LQETPPIRICGQRQLLSEAMRMRAPTQVLAASALALTLGTWPSASTAANLDFGPCASPTSQFSCAALPVPLDRSGALPGTVTLNVERRLAGAAPSHTAVVGLAGGPGQAAVPLGEYIAEAIAPALGARDLLVFDQRGTGASSPLSCAALSPAAAHSSSTVSELVNRCARELGPSRGDFTTQESVEDIEALRQAGGYEKLVLYGTSYGTKVALEYAERYPQHVEALLLDSTEVPGGPEPFHLATFKAMSPALRELCTRACAGITSNPVDDLSRLVAALERHPIKGHAYDQSGRPVAVSVNPADVYGLLLAGDENPLLRAAMPAAVHAALHRDPGPLLRLVVLGRSSSSGEESSGIDGVLFYDTSCEETPFPWQRGATEATRAVEAEAALNALPASDFYPFSPEAGLLFQTIPLCVSWPDAGPPPPAPSPLPNVPTLILSGGQDLRTPTENALRVAQQIPDAQVLKVPYTGHSVLGSDLSSCSANALKAFFAGTPVTPCPASADRFPPAPLAPTTLVGLKATGISGGRGKTVTASIDTVRDLERMILILAFDEGKIPVGARFGGLRGGSVRVTKTATVLDHVTYVPGVQITGAISNDLLLKARGSAATLRVGGPAASAGSIRLLSGHRIEGVLAGRHFATVMPAHVASAGSGQAEWPASAPTPKSSPLTRPR
jgi:pimeloyl-ACP methyl ester carboxylesterase